MIDSLPPISPGALHPEDLRRMLGTDAPVILDIGANNGSTTLEFLQYFPGCTIYAFEPDPRALTKLRSRANHPRVHVFEMAIGAIDGEADFHVSSGMPPDAPTDDFAREYPQGWDMSGSLHAPKTHEQVWPWCKFESTRKVKVCRLDTWAHENLARESVLPQIDLIWADVQGAEGDLITGARETLTRTRYFYTEYSDNEWYEGQPSLARLAAMLDDFSIVHRYRMDVLFRNNAI